METGCLFMQSNPSCSSYVSFRPTPVNAKNMVELSRIFSYMEGGNGTVVVVCHVCVFGGRVSCFLGFVQKFGTYHFDGPHFRKNKNHTIKRANFTQMEKRKDFKQKDNDPNLDGTMVWCCFHCWVLFFYFYKCCS
ncbi:hypothetical protein J1N35_031790 [Gossypium stocksii]|uniref:Uncharacterized protein n=1 Tax=Gossypium stocksii TaxID=47602 RepID=A0A9D3ZV61_9ROSI|nr:hypothetical protein J1N35_031790 [Gossypium stocksii]